MIITKNRYLSILNCMLNYDGIVTSEFLAQICMTSSRTIKDDLNDLNEELKKEGVARIISTRSKGYYLEPIVYEKYIEFKNQIEKNYHFFGDNEVEKTNRRIFICKKLLTDGSINIEELSDMIYTPKTTLTEDIKWIKMLFNSYGIVLEKKSGKGYVFYGDEINYRRIMVEVFCEQYHDITSEYEIDSFNELFYEDREIYSNIRHKVLKIIRESKISLLDINTKKLATGICLMLNRIRKNKPIELSEEIKNLISGNYEYDLANQIVVGLNLQGIPVDEVMNIALNLVIFRDYVLSDPNELQTINISLIKDTDRYMNYILEKLKNTLGGRILCLELFEVYRDKFLSYFISIYIKTLFNTTDNYLLSFYPGVETNYLTPVAMHMLRNIVEYSKQYFNKEFNVSYFMPIGVLIDVLIKHIKYNYKKRRIALCSVSGRVIGKVAAEIINDRFTSFIAYIDVFNQYELRKVNFDDYDILLMNSRNTKYNFYPIEAATYNIMDIKSTFSILSKDVFIKGFEDNYISYIKKQISIYNVTCKKYIDCMELISYKYAKRGKEKELYDAILKHGKTMSYYCKESHLSMIFIDEKYSNKNFIDFYKIDARMIWIKPFEVKGVIVISIPKSIELNEIKMINEVIDRYYYNYDNFLELIEDKNNSINKIIRQIFDEYLAFN